MKVTILGCGPSGGVPLIGCDCPICTSPDLRNRRLRASILIEREGKRLLVDTAPDLRQQALRAGFKTIDAVLYTHNHADHTHGIDEVRSFNFNGNKAIPVYGDAGCMNHLRQQFRYIFPESVAPESWIRPVLIANTIDEYAQFEVEDVVIQSFLQYHGKGKSLGYRIGNFAYSTDVNNLPEQSLQLLESLDVWVVDCLRARPAPTHADLALTLSWIERLKPKRAFLTHMSHELEYQALCEQLPAHVRPAHDGLVIEC